MSRGGRDDDREERSTEPEGRVASLADGGRAPDTNGRETREVVRDARGHPYRLRESEWSALQTIGTFRVVAERDLGASHGQLRHLRDSGLIERRTAMVDHQSERLVVLTKAGKNLLERHREERGLRADQPVYAGFVKPRELAHDAQLYPAYLAERARIEGDGGRIDRVLLDYELKRDYQAWLNRHDKPETMSVEDDRQAFADARGLPIIDGHLEIPDIRLEVTWADGARDIRDVEVVTPHYSHSQIAGKAQAGFALYRTGNAGGGRRSGGASGRGGAVSPRQWEWLR